MKQKATLRDIANECKCSVTTVSRALKDSHTISEATKARIRRTADRLGYIQNLAATSMRTGRTNTLAVCLQDFSNPYFSVIAKYIERYASSLGYSVLFATTNEKPQEEYNVCKTLIERNVDGVLLFPIQQDTKAVQLLSSQKVPYVVVSRRYAELDTDYAAPDDEKAGYQAAIHLIERGARRIAFLRADLSISSVRERVDGYRRALSEHGLSELILEGSMEFGQTERAIREHLPLLRECDALITFCDIMGFEAYYTLTHMGIKIPEDILLTSFDGMQEDTALPVKMTSIGTDKKQIVQRAIDLLLDRIFERAPSEYQHILIDPYLIQGDTT